MSKELFTQDREQALIAKTRLQELEFYNRQIELKHGIQIRPNEQLPARL